MTNTDGVQPTRAWPANKDAEPVPFPKLPPAIVMHPQVGELFDRLQMQTYAMGYAIACAKANAGVPERVMSPSGKSNGGVA